MKSGTLRRMAALLMALLMLVPMAAQAEGAGYYSLTLSDVVLNYMGQEFDFSGMDIKLEGGADIEGHNAVGGVTLSVPAGDASASVALEIDDEKLIMLLLDQLISMPYDQMDELMAMTGADASGLPMGDMAQVMAEFWTALESMASGELEAQLAAALEELSDREWIKALEELQDQPMQLNYMDDLLKLFNDAVPTEMEFMVGEETYTGRVAEVTLTAEQATEMISGAITDLYAGEQIMSVMGPLMADMDAMMAQIAAMSDMPEAAAISYADVYEAMVDALAQMSIPSGINMYLCVAEREDGSTVMRMIWDRFTLDMSGYMQALMESMGQPMDEEEMEQAMGMSAIDMSMDISQIGAGDGSLTIAQPEFVEELVCIYLPDADTSLFEVYAYVDDYEGGVTNFCSVVIDPAGAGLESEYGYFDIALDSYVGDDGSMLGGLYVYLGERELLAAEYDLSNTDGVNSLFADVRVEEQLMTELGMWGEGSAELELNWADDLSAVDGYLGVYVGEDQIGELTGAYDAAEGRLDMNAIANCDALVLNGIIDGDIDGDELKNMEQPYHVIALALNAATDSDEKTESTKVTFTMDVIDQRMMGMEFNASQTDMGDNKTGGALNLMMDSELMFDTDEPIEVFGIEYTYADNSTEELSEYDITFSGELMGQLGLSFSLNATGEDMDASKLISTYVTDALNLTEATEDDMEALQLGVQSAMSKLMSALMEYVPGMEMIMGNIEGGIVMTETQTATVELEEADGSSDGSASANATIPAVGSAGKLPAIGGSVITIG